MRINHLERNFVRLVMEYALRAEEETGVSAILLIALSAFDTNWGGAMYNNQCFAIRRPNGRESFRLVQEITADPLSRNLIHSTPFRQDNQLMWANTKKVYWISYDSKLESFMDQAKYLLKYQKGALKAPLYLAPAKLKDYCYAKDFARNMQLILERVQWIIMKM